MAMSNRHASFLLTSAKAPSVTQLPGPARIFRPLHGTPHFGTAGCLVGWHAFLQGSDPSRSREITTTTCLGQLPVHHHTACIAAVTLGGVHQTSQKYRPCR
jgi:hypothetical protein